MLWRIVSIICGCIFRGSELLTMRNNLKVERAKMNFTQADLAGKVNVSRQTINSIEIGKFVPSTVLALKIAFVFNVAIGDIFILEEADWL